MNSYILDTSVAVAWYLNESFSVQAREWQEKFLSGKIGFIVPSLHYSEFANVLRTLVIRRELEPELTQNIYEIHNEAPLEIIDPDPRTLLDIAMDYNTTAYDAVYIALSILNNIPIVTAERTTTAWVRKMGDMVDIVRVD